MNTKQVVAVIGASGKMGAALARTLTKGNYKILLHSTKRNKVQGLVEEIQANLSYADIDIVDDYIEIGWEADVVILAVPYGAEKKVAENIKTVVNQKIIISVSNPFNNHYGGLLTPSGISAADELQKLLPNAKVVKAFNTVFARDFYRHVVHKRKLDCFIAGNDENALEQVYDLVKTAGFHPVIAGDLSKGRILENIQLLLVQLAMQNNYKEIAGWKIFQTWSTIME